MIMVGNDMGLYIAVMVLTLAIGGGAPVVRHHNAAQIPKDSLLVQHHGCSDGTQNEHR